jgi:superfamily II DNA/RNA helicase
MGIPYNHLDKKTDFETYLHRIGRTGRMGDVGIALNIIGNLKFK